jgi:hypothetical protein
MEGRVSLLARAIAAAMVVSSGLAFVGCKQNGSNSPAAPLPPPIARTGVTRAGEHVDLSRPVGRPAPVLDRTNSSVRAELRQLGSVPFDALTLPLLATVKEWGDQAAANADEPDLWIATQHGTAPSWPVLLADGTPESRRVPGNVRISAYRVVRKSVTLRAVEWPRPLPSGLVLGRSADDRGFLVESPRPDGARWIGRVAWETGDIEWLVGGEDADAIDARGVAAFATLGPAGELAYSRKGPSGSFDLVVRAQDGTDRTLVSPAGHSLVCPTFSADRGRVYVLSVPPLNTDMPRLLAVDLSGDARELHVSSFATLNFEPSIGAAWQSVMCLTTPWLGTKSNALANGLAFLSLETGSMAWMNGSTGVVTPLARGTVGAAPCECAGASVGLVLGAAGELLFQSSKSVSGPAMMEFLPETAVVPGAFVPRLSWRGSRSTCGIVLVAPPVGDTGGMVGVFELLPDQTGQRP